MVLLCASAAVAIPIVLVALWRWRRTMPAARQVGRGALLVAMVLLAMLWIPLAGVATVLVGLEEPWPLSWRQGPDTNAARTVFRENFGFDAPATVTSLYARDEFAGPGEHVTSITFSYLDDGVIETIVRKTSLVRVPAGDLNTLPAHPGPRWFPAEGVLRGLPEAYRQEQPDHPQVFRHLWIDRANRRVHFQDVDTA